MQHIIKPQNVIFDDILHHMTQVCASVRFNGLPLDAALRHVWSDTPLDPMVARLSIACVCAHEYTSIWNLLCGCFCKKSQDRRRSEISLRFLKPFSFSVLFWLSFRQRVADVNQIAGSELKVAVRYLDTDESGPRTR